MTEEENETIDNWPLFMREYPFTRKGMTVREYEEEKAYYLSMSVDDLKYGRYKPLWKQREEAGDTSTFK